MDLKALMTGVLLLVGFLQTTAQFTLKVNVTGIEEIKGNLEICLYDNEGNYMWTSKATKCARFDVSKLSESFVFDSLPEGTYAIVVIQDLNSNGNLDSNWMRIPKEPYGFSNNPSTMFGPPNFKGASFKLTTNLEVEIKLK